MLTEAILSAIVEAVAGRILSLGERRGPGESRFSLAGAREAVVGHLDFVQNWSRQISFLELRRPKPLSSAFVNLDLYLGMKRHSEGAPERMVRVSELLGLPGNLVILGDPGGGKTTSLKRVAQDALAALAVSGGAPRLVPFVIRLRDLEREGRDEEYAHVGPLVRRLAALLGVTIQHEAEDRRWTVDPGEVRALMDRLVPQLLERIPAVLLLDGLDEISGLLRGAVIRDVEFLLLHATRAKVVLTCRSGELTTHFENCTVLELAQLTRAQIADFAEQWLGAREGARFLAEVARTPYSGAEVRPLNLAHLCAIFEKSRKIPPRPEALYSRIVRLLLTEWDEQRGVQRVSRFAEFDIDRKERFLEALAYEITQRFHVYSFSHFHLEHVYLHLHGRFGLPREQATAVVREVESHSGLLVETSYGIYEFVHRSIQEYLTGRYLVKLPVLPETGFLLDHPHEMAMAVYLSSARSAWFTAVVRDVAAAEPIRIPTFAATFLSRLLLERTEFEFTPDLGLAVLLLTVAAETGFAARLAGQQRIVTEFMETDRIKMLHTLLAFLRDEQVERSVALFLHLCDREETRDGGRVLRPNPAAWGRAYPSMVSPKHLPGELRLPGSIVQGLPEPTPPR